MKDQRENEISSFLSLSLLLLLLLSYFLLLSVRCRTDEERKKSIIIHVLLILLLVIRSLLPSEMPFVCFARGITCEVSSRSTH